MARIQQLPTSVITKIAAGEVIERPASVVKELLENSLDAGSTRLDIDVEDGGAELIRVADNGCGIHPDDLALAFSNHATSKLAAADDLFFGKEVRQALYALDANYGPAHLYGFIADPGCDRGNPKLQYLFLNGRWIRDRALLHALQEGYRGLLMTGRYAVALLFLDLPPDQVDVNGHPTKAEVRFRDANALYRLVLATVRNRLAQEKLVARLQVPVSGPVFSFPANGNA